MLDYAQSATAHSVEDTYIKRRMQRCASFGLHLSLLQARIAQNEFDCQQKHKIQIGCVAYPLGTEVSYVGEKAAGSQS